MIDHLEANLPTVVYIAGKTCTGKTTLAKRLADSLSYGVVELDRVVVEEFKPHSVEARRELFVHVYRERVRMHLVSRFVDSARAAAAAHLRCVVDGAIANVETLAEVFAGMNPFVAYLHPADLATYEERLTQRFITATPSDAAGLPASFWKYIAPESFVRFDESRKLTVDLKKAIAAYARASQAESTERLELFKTRFRVVSVDV